MKPQAFETSVATNLHADTSSNLAEALDPERDAPNLNSATTQMAYAVCEALRIAND